MSHARLASSFAILLSLTLLLSCSHKQERAENYKAADNVFDPYIVRCGDSYYLAEYKQAPDTSPQFYVPLISQSAVTLIQFKNRPSIYIMDMTRHPTEADKLNGAQAAEFEGMCYLKAYTYRKGVCQGCDPNSSLAYTRWSAWSESGEPVSLYMQKQGGIWKLTYADKQRTPPNYVKIKCSQLPQQ